MEDITQETNTNDQKQNNNNLSVIPYNSDLHTIWPSPNNTSPPSTEWKNISISASTAHRQHDVSDKIFNYRNERYSFADIKNMCCDELEELQTRMEKDIVQLSDSSDNPWINIFNLEQLMLLMNMRNLISCSILNKKYDILASKQNKK